MFWLWFHVGSKLDIFSPMFVLNHLSMLSLYGTFV
uniref:Uncharacterized protein n=1 Tax=Rhizophora mucronata TaxID=61149 RepID=A0A2P2Q6L4_RHIMU